MPVRSFQVKRGVADTRRLARRLLAAFVALACAIAVLSCAGSPTPAEPVLAASATPTATQTPSPTATSTPTATQAPSPTATPTQTATETPATPAAIPVCTFQIVSAFPHDPAAFTQGLIFENGSLYEGTGLYGQSTLRRVDLESGEVLQAISLPPAYFGEGITIWEDRILQLTWRSGIGFVYDRQSFELLASYQYPTEGWGITHDGSTLIMSDGTPTLHFWDPDTLVETGSISVYDDAGPVTWLNELEYIQGMVYANVWQTDRIAVIDPLTGQVTAWIDLQGLLAPEDSSAGIDVLNGIAYDEQGDRLFVTGKLWPKLFEIELISPDGSPAPLTCQ